MRQQGQKASKLPNICLSDFIAPESSDKEDYIGAFAVTAGLGIETLLEQYEKDHDDYNSIMLKAIADRLIGGATTSRIHTAVKIDPHYHGPVIHVLDASRSVPVAGRLMQNEKTHQEIYDEIKTEYARLRDEHAGRKRDKNYISIDAARENKTAIDWSNFQGTKPKFLGTKVFEDYDIAEIAKYIDLS